LEFPQNVILRGHRFRASQRQQHQHQQAASSASARNLFFGWPSSTFEIFGPENHRLRSRFRTDGSCIRITKLDVWLRFYLEYFLRLSGLQFSLYQWTVVFLRGPSGRFASEIAQHLLFREIQTHLRFTLCANYTPCYSRCREFVSRHLDSRQHLVDVVDFRDDVHHYD
jgi:hypothetical protein